MHRLQILLFSVCTLTMGGLLACAADGRGDDDAAREVGGALSQQQPRADAGARDLDRDADEDIDEATDEANDTDTDTDSDEDCDSDSDETQDEVNDVDTDSDSDERCGAPAAPAAPVTVQSRTP